MHQFFCQFVKRLGTVVQTCGSTTCISLHVPLVRTENGKTKQWYCTVHAKAYECTHTHSVGTDCVAASSLLKGNGSHHNPNLCRHRNPHTYTHQKYTDIRQELTEWHLNMLPWHRACRHGNSIRGKSGLWDVPLGFLFMHFPFCQSLWQAGRRGRLLTIVTHTELWFGCVRVDGVQTTGVSVCTLLSTPTGSMLKAYKPSMRSCCRSCNAEWKLLLANKQHMQFCPKDPKRNEGAIRPDTPHCSSTTCNHSTFTRTHTTTHTRAVVESVRQ